MNEDKEWLSVSVSIVLVVEEAPNFGQKKDFKEVLANDAIGTWEAPCEKVAGALASIICLVRMIRINQRCSAIIHHGWTRDVPASRGMIDHHPRSSGRSGKPRCSPTGRCGRMRRRSKKRISFGSS